MSSSKICIRGSDGKPSLSATMAVIAVCVVMVKVMLSGASVNIGGATYDFGSIDAAMIAAILTPILGTYTARRWGHPIKSPSEPIPKGPDDNEDPSGGKK